MDLGGGARNGELCSSLDRDPRGRDRCCGTSAISPLLALGALWYPPDSLVLAPCDSASGRVRLTSSTSHVARQAPHTGPYNPRLLLTGAYARRGGAFMFGWGPRGGAARPGSRSAGR